MSVMNPEPIAAPVSKTAIDALNAKVSAVSVGYDPVSIGHNDDLYKDLLQKMQKTINGITFKSSSSSQSSSKSKTKNAVRRQSPLVNAGYALRVAALSKMIHEFIFTCQRDQDHKSGQREVNLVLLGCGLDVLGLWAAGNSKNVNLYEIDCLENCQLKRSSLIESGLIVPLKPETDEKCENEVNDCVFLEGWLNVKGVNNEAEYLKNTAFKISKSDHINYFLMCADLRCIASLRKAFQASNFNTELPTMVVSELVLAYLCKDKVQELLSYVSENICLNEQSMFIAYEPVFSSCIMNSVVHGYTNNYFGQFESKLNKGNAESYQSNNLNPFQPIGDSQLGVIHKLRSCGFDGLVDCKTIAQAAKFWDLRHVQSSPELFDEHAAFRLHLQCYSVTGATVSCASETLSNFKKVCPWSNPDDATNGMGRQLKRRIGPIGTNENLILCSIQKDDQEQVRNLFSGIYTHLFVEYPSVKKMVKSAFKSDLSVKVDKSKQTPVNDECAIWYYYSCRGGSFWVVLDQSCDNKVVGCIGITKLSSNTFQSTESASYEINRLVVAPELRGMGLGKILLQNVEEFVLAKEISGNVNINATTPEILEAANFLYTSCSYTKINENLMGSMVMNTYKKVIR